MDREINVFFTVPRGEIRKQLWTPAASELAREFGFSVHLNSFEGSPSMDEWAELLSDADAVITTWGAPVLGEQVLSRNPGLKIVGHAAGSVANIVSPYLYDRGIRVVTANSAMARSVAEWNLMMTFVAARNLLKYASFGSGGHPDSGTRDSARSPSELVVGIWGFGDVARHLITMLRPFAPRRFLVHDPYLSEEAAMEFGVEAVTLEQLVVQSDILHALTGLTAETKGGLDAALLGKMKPGATLINAGRAALIVEAALLEALRSGRISAILDVHYREPVRSDDPFVGVPNVIMTPHCAGRPGRDHYVPLVLREFDRFFRGRPLRHEITRERALNMTDARLVGRT